MPNLLRLTTRALAVGALPALVALAVGSGTALGATPGAPERVRAADPGAGVAARRPPPVRPRVRRVTTQAMRNPLLAAPLFVERGGPAWEQVRAWRGERPGDARLIEEIARQPHAMWLGEWLRDVRSAAAERVRAARATGTIPVFVAYNIPDRDCGLHSQGGATDPGSYRRWIEQIALGIDDSPAAVILEPDALAGADCLSEAGRGERSRMIADAVARLSALPETAVYIDAGNPTWRSADEMARRLRAAGVGRARGFAVNVSSFSTTAASRAYGRAVARRIPGPARFVIDTSRNGRGPAADDSWCNPSGRGIGERPGAQPGDRAVDALLWVKRPGESDGSCNGGPAAGSWWPEGALELARNAMS